MPTPTYTPLATVTVATSASSITFSNIPATYRDLILVTSTRISSGGAGVRLQFNGDTGSNYNTVMARGGTSPVNVSSQVLSSQTNVFVLGQGWTSSGASPSPAITQIMDYSATDKHKTVLNRGQAFESTGGETEIEMTATRWGNTAAINAIAVFPTASTFNVNTTVSLYGVIA